MPGAFDHSSGMAAARRGFLVAVGIAVCLVAYLCPYLFMLEEWWRWIPSTVLIVMIGVAFHGCSTDRFFGLKISLRSTATTVMLFSALVPICSFVLLDFLNQPPLEVHAHAYRPKHFGQFFQVFSDEIVLRAATITILLRWFHHPRAVSLVVATLFALGHHLLYRLYGSEIGWQALVTLFSFGAIANLLFVHFGHVGYSLAAHYAWNFYRFNSGYFVDGNRISQGETFNYVEGNAWVATTALTGFVCVYVFISHAWDSEVSEP